mmetsp:Transcript_44109/g.88469  ORF Transcript_44109/g.88469 Transcript_44109/m.88469 type:complete len:397 (-) Transcript_44109:658-1848(-)
MFRKKVKTLNLSKLGLVGWLIKVCEKKNIIFPSITQQACIPPLLSGKDLLVYSNPGSGKILTFILPILHLTSKTPICLYSIIIIPTEELGVQISTIFNDLGKDKRIESLFIQKNFSDMKKKIVNCLIITSNFLPLFLKKKRFFLVLRPKFWVIDGVEILFQDLHFLCISEIFKFFSPTQIMLIGMVLKKNHRYLSLAKTEKNFFFFHEKRNSCPFIFSVKHKYIFCPFNAKIKFLMAIIEIKMDIAIENKTQILVVFFSSEKGCEKVITKFEKTNFYSFKSEKEIKKNLFLFSFQKGKTKIKIFFTNENKKKLFLFPRIDLIINFDFPKCPSVYVNRIFEFSRLFKGNYCLNLINQEEIKLLAKFEYRTGIYLKKFNLKENNLLPYFIKKEKKLKE